MTKQTFSRLSLVIISAGLILALTAGTLSVPLQMVSTVGSGKPSPLTLSTLEQRSYLYAGNGGLMAALHEEINRQPITLPEVPPHVVNAILAVEDAGFWVHDGVNVRGLLRAFGANVGSGSISQGGSTITQQVVKLAVLGSKKTIDRKVREMVLAERLEKQMSKEDILTRYLNTVYFGNHAYGIQAAAETYFGVSARDLDLGQAALLAGIIRNPSAYNPVRAPDKAQARRHVALERMLAEGIITSDQATLIDAAPVPTEVHQVLPLPNDYFVEEVKQQLLDDQTFGLGATPEARENAVFNGGLKIYTTFDPRAQELALAARDAQLGQGGVFDIGPAINPDTRRPLINPETGQPMIDPNTGDPLRVQGTASIVSVEPATGAIRAMVAGPGFDQYKFNLATQNPRQGGSSFKTFVLTTLMEEGYSPDDIVDGTGPCMFPMPSAAPYIAENFGGSGGSVDTITHQTTHSSNCAYLRLGQIAGIGNVIDVARRLGVTAPLNPEIVSTPLGTQEITPLEMAGAYAGIANDGWYNKPYYIERIEDATGRVIYQHALTPQPAVTPESARKVTWVLEQNVEAGTGTAARLRSRPTAGKTGTAQDSADAWFVGYTHQLATAVWVGGMGGRLPIRLGGAGITGGSYPARIWGAYMAPWHDGQPVEGFPPPGAIGGGRQLSGVPASAPASGGEDPGSYGP
ncbi:MAG TPA: transglycosylase domain-containing protein, partial [Acidimicrobiales bacterium]